MNSTGVFVVYKIPPKIENEDPLPTLKITCMKHSPWSNSLIIEGLVVSYQGYGLLLLDKDNHVKKKNRVFLFPPLLRLMHR